MQQFFDAQMRLLTEAGKQFAENYPEHAGLLNIDSIKERDPHVERLLEGVAYLNAHVHKRLDESLPEVSEQVLRQLCPALLNYYPSTTVFQFTPKFSMNESLVVKKGLEITTEHAVEQVKCKFTTCHDLKVLPLTVQQADIVDTYHGSELKITFKWACQGELENYDLSRLRLYLDGDTPLVTALYQLLLTSDKEVMFDFGASHYRVNKPYAVNVTSALLEPHQALLPNASTSHPGYALLQDYFNGRERFNFVDVCLPMQLTLPSELDEFSLVFKGPVKLPPGHKLSANNIKLNCVVGINLFTLDAEPIHLQLNRTEYLVVPDKDKQHYIYAYCVDQISGRDKLTAQAHEYLPRYRSVFGDEKRLYTLSLKDIGAAVPSHYINIAVGHDGVDDTLSTQLTCYNGKWPKQTIREGQLTSSGKNMPSLLTVKNIARPTNFKTSKASSSYWQLISLLNLKFSSLAEANQLKQLLALFDWSERSENKRRIDAIMSVKSQKFNQITRGIFVQGAELVITLDESKFSGLADVYHFGSVLHQFFVMYAPINQSVQTRIECIPSYQEFVWTVAPGQSAHL
ncbi:type VI secretion system baseplate subunit TssF [Thalassotalea ganghwensis]